jgi:hypothetical protein
MKSTEAKSAAQGALATPAARWCDIYGTGHIVLVVVDQKFQWSVKELKGNQYES